MVSASHYVSAILVSIHLCRAGFHQCWKQNTAQLKEKRQIERHLWIQTVLQSNAAWAKHWSADTPHGGEGIQEC